MGRGFSGEGRAGTPCRIAGACTRPRPKPRGILPGSRGALRTYPAAWRRKKTTYAGTCASAARRLRRAFSSASSASSTASPPGARWASRRRRGASSCGASSRTRRRTGAPSRISCAQGPRRSTGYSPPLLSSASRSRSASSSARTAGRARPAQRAKARAVLQPQGLHARSAAPAQNLLHEGSAVALPQLLYAPDRGARILAGVHGPLVLLVAVGAVPAALPRLFPEIPQDVAAQAVPGGAVSGHAAQPFAHALAHGAGLLLGEQRVLLLLLDQEGVEPDVLPAVEQGADRVRPVPARAPRLLIVGLQVLGHVVVDDEGDVGLVDAHAEGVRGDHHLRPVVQEVVLILAALGVGQARVVARRRDAARTQRLADLLHGPPRQAVDDAAFSPSAPGAGAAGRSSFRAGARSPRQSAGLAGQSPWRRRTGPAGPADRGCRPGPRAWRWP